MIYPLSLEWPRCLRMDLTFPGFPGDSNSKESACNARKPGSISGLGRAPGKGMGAHSSTLALSIPWKEEPGGLQPWGHMSQTQLRN